jgi:hypothetical protein
MPTVEPFPAGGCRFIVRESAAAPISCRKLPGDAAAQGRGTAAGYMIPYPGLIVSLVGDPSSGRCGLATLVYYNQSIPKVRAALIRRTRQAGVARYRFSVTHWP